MYIIPSGDTYFHIYGHTHFKGVHTTLTTVLSFRVLRLSGCVKIKSWQSDLDFVD